MNRDDYRAAFDQIQFREEFQRETVDLLLDQAGQRQEKESLTMKANQLKRMPLIAAALAAVLIVSAAAAAATLFLRPADVARHVDNPTLAEAFESSDAILVDQSVESKGYRFTFAGVVSGAGLSKLSDDVDTERTYAVLSAARLDGQPMTMEEQMDMTASPLISGYLPWSVNAWTLHGGYTRFLDNGITYYLYEYDSVEMFADRTIYFAMYEGMSPNSDMFRIADDGSISFQDSYTAPHALFTLPLDPSKADPAAVAQFEQDMRDDGWLLTLEEMGAAIANSPAESDEEEPYFVMEPGDGDSEWVIVE